MKVLSQFYFSQVFSSIDLANVSNDDISSFGDKVNLIMGKSRSNDVIYNCIVCLLNFVKSLKTGNKLCFLNFTFKLFCNYIFFV